MTPRVNPYEAAPEVIEALRGVERALKASALDRRLVELVKLRVSQLNGCAFCLHMHAREARAAGEAEDRILLLPAWRESQMYAPRERAALAWAEALTRLDGTPPPQAAYDAAAAAFGARELAELTAITGMINLWNRLMLGFGVQHTEDRRQAHPGN